MRSLTDTFLLNNGNTIPCLGYGTWKAPDDADTVRGVLDAIELGYRHIDTAAAYGNEASVGRAVKESGVKREELFITTKLHNPQRGYETTKRALQASLERLEMDYVDLFLIHWPANEAHNPKSWIDINMETWRAMTEMYKAGYIRNIGVSNFHPRHMEALLTCDVKPAINQIEFHPGCLQKEMVRNCRANGIVVEAWSPLGNGEILSDPLLVKLAEKYGRTAAQICLRYVLQSGVLPLTKSTKKERIEQNAQIFDFELSAEDMAMIDAMPENGTGWLPETVPWSKQPDRD